MTKHPVHYIRPVKYREREDRPYKIYAEFYVTEKNLFTVSGGLTGFPDLKPGEAYILYRALDALQDRLADSEQQNADIKPAFEEAQKKLSRELQSEGMDKNSYAAALDNMDEVDSIRPYIRKVIHYPAKTIPPGLT